MTLDVIIAHFQSNAMAYLAGIIVFGPLIFFTRRWSLPVIMWIIEILIYSVIMHIVIHYFVKIVVWFQSSTQMERAFDREKLVETWGTPLLDFWDRSKYDPTWIFYTEAVFVFLFCVLVFRMRPYKVQKIKPKAAPRPGQPGYKPGSTYSNPRSRKR